MQCSKCQFENREGAKFCKKCGAKLENICPQCSTPLTPDSLFCDECGYDLRHPKQVLEEITEHKIPALHRRIEKSPDDVTHFLGERKRVTVIFSDISGYTSMSERLDPEEVKDVTTQIFDKISKIVNKYEGFIEKYAGDAVMILFGAHTSHEEDPIRAIRAAREIHNMVDSLSPKYEESIHQTLSMHTGINTGLVVTGELNVQKGLHGVVGDTLNAASRLSNLAKEGEILVGPDTHRQAEKYFIFKRLDSVKLKGKAKPIVPYSVLGESKIQTRLEAAEKQGFGVYTGREQELNALHVCLEKVIAGQGQFVTVVGEAGIGKSRLLFEFGQSLDRNQVMVIEGRCQYFGIDTPYLPIINALRRELDLREDDSPAKLLQKAVTNIQNIDPTLKAYIPYYLHLLSISSDKYLLPENLKGEDLKRTLQESLAAIITLNTQHKPMVLILEDWHWVDDASDSALKHLVSMSPSYPLMIVVLYRLEYQADWGSTENHTPLVLKSLERQNTEEIIKSTFHVSRLPDGLGEMIHARTGGNPLFTEEVAQSLIDQGLVFVKNRQAILTQSAKKLHLPDTVQAVISSRFDRMDEKMKETLRLASVIGREFAQRILERVTPSPKNLSKPLVELKALEVIQQIRLLPDAEYIFKHVLTQIVVYESLLLKRRRELHRIVGQAIEEFYGDRLGEQYEALAHHYSNSDNHEKAIQFLELAGDKATRYFSLGEARTHYRAAIEFLAAQKKSPDIQNSFINLSLKWAEVSHYVASRDHVEILKLSLEYTHDLKNEAQIAKTTYWIARMEYSLGNMFESLPYYEKCIEMADLLEGGEMRALPYNFIGRICLFTSEWVKAVNYLEKGIPMLKRLGNLDEIAYSTGMLGLIYGFMGNFEKGFSLINKALHIAIEIDNKTREAVSLMYRCGVYLYQGAWKESLKYGSQAVDICKEIENPVIEGLTTWVMGYSVFLKGERQKGLDLLRAGIEKEEAAGSNFSLGLGYGWRAEAHALADQDQEAQFCINKSFDLAKIGERWGEVFAYRALAIVAAKKTPPDWDKVDFNMRKSLRLAEQRGSRVEKATGCFRYAELLRNKGDLDQALVYLTQAKKLFIKMNMSWWIEQTKKFEEELL